jgi:RNA polymerase sigma-B factor
MPAAGASQPNEPEALVTRFLPLARKLARRYHRGGDSLADLVQVASLGLVKAAQRYDEGRGVPFPSYAVHVITGELRRYFRDCAWAVHVPRALKERALDVNRAAREAADRTGRTPRPSELAERLALDEQDVIDALQAYRALVAGPLDAPRSGDELEPQTLADTIGSIDDRYELADDRLTIVAAVRKLPLRDRRVFYMRFVEGRAQADIAARIGMSQMAISLILSRTLEHVRLTLAPTAAQPQASA